MNKILAGVILILLMKGQSAWGQNLVPNPSFEDTVACPFGTNQLNSALGWESYRNSPDYFNGSSPTGTNVPNSNFGYQNAHSGNAFAGMGTYRQPNSPNGPNYREFIGCSLIGPLTIGQKYYISFYANFAYTDNVAIGSNNIGIKLSTQSFSISNPAPIDNQSLINYNTILIDSINWIKLTGSFVADSAYDHLILGNFYTDINTDTIILSQNPDYAYYYIDDVCLSADSNYCERWTATALENLSTKLNIFPNPFFDIINIHSNQNNVSIEIYSLNGHQVCKLNDIRLNNSSIDLSFLARGIFLTKIIFKDKTYNKILYKL